MGTPPALPQALLVLAAALALIGPETSASGAARAVPPRPVLKPPAAGPRVFPRRALVISVNNYLYANPVQDFGKGPSSVNGLVRALSGDGRSGGLQVPFNQVGVLSDLAAPEKERRPPLKAVI